MPRAEGFVQSDRWTLKKRAGLRSDIMDAANVFVLFLTVVFFALIGYLSLLSKRKVQRTDVESEKKKDDVRRAA
jgi:hypothetical protein